MLIRALGALPPLGEVSLDGLPAGPRQVQLVRGGFLHPHGEAGRVLTSGGMHGYFMLTMGGYAEGLDG